MKELFAALASADLDERHAAVEKIAAEARKNPSVRIPEINEALKAGPADLRWYLGRALIKIGEETVTQYIIDFSENETDLEIQKYYGAVLAAFGEGAILTLIDLFESPNPTTRGMASAALVRIGAPAAPYLLDAAKSDNPLVKLCVGMTLQKIGVFDY
ncbi:MAG TPA: HEAT repeat domain-containing protein [Methanocorpusculum sp.]|nr:HEAT repeat domain-containing protein [Methanocorpusculum sp.]